MPTAATATLTFLFTDIEGSTQRWENQREAMSAALVRHDEILRGAIERHGGHVFKTVGDAFYGAFSDAAAALEAALDAQRALLAQDWGSFGPDFADLRVRMAIHHGRVEARGGDYFGPALNRTARLMSAGHGDQILLSLATQQVVRDLLPPGVTLRDWGEHRLKDLRHSEHIWQVLAPDLADVTTAPVTTDRLDARDRIVVDETGAERSPEDTLAALLAGVRSEEAQVTLTVPQIRQVLERRVRDLTEYRLARIAEWSQPRYPLDGRFVALTLLVDKGEEVARDRWVAKEERYDDLDVLLANVEDPAVVVLGPPGSGKSTLLRHLDLETGIAALRGEDARDTVTFFIQLNQYAPERAGEGLPLPGQWLARRWAVRFPELPPLEHLLEEGRLV
jgi:class 3 adenylate cyclase